MIDRSDYEKTIAQLIGAAELVASGVAAEDDKMHAFEALAFFRLRRQRIGEVASADNDPSKTPHWPRLRWRVASSSSQPSPFWTKRGH